MRGFQEIVAETVVYVSGVSTILGEFSQHCQGRVLCYADNQSLQVRLTPSPDNQVHIRNTLTGDKKRFSLTNLKYRKEDKWGNYAKGVFYQLIDEGYSPKACDIVLEGDILKSDGPMLSAAISVGVCLALKKAQKLEFSDNDAAMLCFRACTSFCSENTQFSTIKTMFEAKAGKFMLFDLGTMSFEYLDDPFAESPQCMLVVDCNIPPEAMREEIRLRHRQTVEAFGQLRAKAPQFPIRDFPVSELKDRLIPVDEETRRLCATVLEDSATAANMRKMFERKDCIQIGKSLGRMGKLMRDDIELSCPEMDWMVKRAAEVPSCYGASILFSGINTYVLLVLDRASVALYKAKLDGYERIFGFMAEVSELTPCGTEPQGIR